MCGAEIGSQREGTTQEQPSLRVRIAVRLRCEKKIRTLLHGELDSDPAQWVPHVLDQSS